ncbi:pantetheine-phosphate adenylyltransferase [Parapedobacter sp. SGR-10]|uniref:pantetheine-phosphate adenylyltransferase n=1 Tax=Parapedobacter sp. SGR-10 TaxID=2710879 RepID=UPI0013D58238|nr:pantetheine-phosphate adenylyltransferase [Parapedobacter sp. SGR-10]NGF56582.1 pantetheine-phosphate adenylyltransferase [Parapedobacter sp. SGR-10]
MKIAVFPGSFDPFTLAHKDIVDRGAELFDRIVIAIGINTTKKGLMEYEQRLTAIKEVYADNPKVEAVIFTGLTVNYCQSIGANYILRGLRNGKDLEYENAIAQNNFMLAPQVETYFLLSRGDKAHISSTIVREILANNGKIDHLVPKEVLAVLNLDSAKK